MRVFPFVRTPPPRWSGVAAVCCAVLALAAQPLPAQQLRLWDTWDDRPDQVITIGFGLNAGLAGVSYTRFVRGSPFAFGVGAGAFGVAARIEITMPRLHVHRAWMDEPETPETYLSLGVVAVPFPRMSDLTRPAVMLEGGRRYWSRRSGRRGALYTDFGFGFAGRPWAAPDDVFFVPMVRAQIGVSF